jgi:hypothetical protein
LHNEELHILYFSPNIIRQIKSRRMKWAGHVARMGEDSNVCRVLMGKPEGKRPLERPWRRWEDGIRIDRREIGCGSVNWFQLAQDRDRWRAVVNTVINLLVLAPGSSYYIQDLFFLFLFLFLLIACDILRAHMSVSMFICIFLVIMPLGIQKRNLLSANKSNAITVKY